MCFGVELVSIKAYNTTQQHHIKYPKSDVVWDADENTVCPPSARENRLRLKHLHKTNFVSLQGALT